MALSGANKATFKVRQIDEACSQFYSFDLIRCKKKNTLYRDFIRQRNKQAKYKYKICFILHKGNKMRLLQENNRK